MGRDRDPFDRTMAALRARLARAGPLQGAALPINGLAAELGVSPTPVREALARLAGEGLIVRTAAGYAGVVHDPESLAGLYDLARVLTIAQPTGAWPFGPASATIGDRPSVPTGSQALVEALQRVRRQLAPFAIGEQHVLSGVEAEQARLEAAVFDPPRLRAGLVTRFYTRRATAAGRILAASLGLLGERRI